MAVAVAVATALVGGDSGTCVARSRSRGGGKVSVEVAERWLLC